MFILGSKIQTLSAWEALVLAALTANKERALLLLQAMGIAQLPPNLVTKTTALKVTTNKPLKERLPQPPHPPLRAHRHLPVKVATAKTTTTAIVMRKLNVKKKDTSVIQTTAPGFIDVSTTTEKANPLHCSTSNAE